MRAAHVIRPVLCTTLLVCGAHFFVYALTGRGLVARARELVARRRDRSTPSQERLPPPPPSDPIDEASWESFPASDPPAISPKYG